MTPAEGMDRGRRKILRAPAGLTPADGMDRGRRKILRAPRRRSGFTLVEILIAIGLLAIAAVLVTQMIQGGSTGMTYAVWHRDRLAESQRFLQAFERDLKSAAGSVTIDINEPSGADQIKIADLPFRYEKGGASAAVEAPATGAPKDLPVTKADPEVDPATAAARKLFSFTIQKAKVLTGPAEQPGYSIRVDGALRGTQLVYSKTLVNGSLAGSDEEAFAPRVVLSDVSYVHLSHTDIASQFTTGDVAGAVVYLFVKFENPQLARAGRMGFTAKQSFRINTRAVQGFSGGGS